ncbi:MAG: SRPBCC domain-containing protein [Spirochaetes bacterium]|nr:MAG: SRPBCC domain-containing protein [Spirochaetota bacterium]
MKEIRISIRIAASPSRVWDIFSDFSRYPEWNPFIRGIRGEFSAGGRLSVELAPPDARPMTFKPRVLVNDPGREFRWKGHLLVPGVFDGEHIFELTGDGGATVFTQREIFTGILVPLFAKMLDDNTRRGFESMNEALRLRCEKGSG